MSLLIDRDDYNLNSNININQNRLIVTAASRTSLFSRYDDDKLSYSFSRKDNDKIKFGFLKFIFANKRTRLFVKALNNFMKNKQNEAVYLLRNSLEKNTFETDLNFMLAIISNNLNEQQLAIERAIQNRNKLGSLFNKLNIHLEINLFITEDMYIKIINDQIGLLLISLFIYQKANLLEKSIKLINKHYPDFHSREIKLFLGELYYHNQEYDQAIRLLQDISDDDLIGLMARIIMGMSFREKGMKRAAIKILRKTRRSKTKIHSLILEGRYQLAVSLEKANKKQLAQREYEKILAVKYDYRDVRQKIMEGF